MIRVVWFLMERLLLLLWFVMRTVPIMCLLKSSKP